MVLAYAVIGEAELHRPAMRALADAQEVWAPDSLRAELTNVLWQWVRRNRLPLADGQAALGQAGALVTHFISTEALWEEALRLAVEHDHPAYDTLFIALAAATDSRVVTHDAALLARYPGWTTALTTYE